MKDIGKAFGLPFKGPSWASKFLIAGLFMLLCFIGIGIPILVGYLIQVTQRVIRREEHVLPDWNDIGIKFVLGFKYCIVYLVYLIPVFLLVIPVIGLVAATSATDAPEMVGVLSIIYMFGFTLLVIPYSLLLTAIFPIIAYRFALREKISDAIDLGKVFRDFRGNGRTRWSWRLSRSVSSRLHSSASSSSLSASSSPCSTCTWFRRGCTVSCIWSFPRNGAPSK